jgi:hypothetical protein
MKSRLLLIPAILVTTAALADTSSAFSDLQAQAAALLSRPNTFVVGSVHTKSSASSVESEWDGHARAAALLSSSRAEGPVTSVSVVQASAGPVDAHEQAAALLSGSRTYPESEQRAQKTRVASGRF